MTRIILALLIIAVLALAITFNPQAQETGNSKANGAPPVGDYASVRFMEDRTSIVWPDGTVENVMDLVPKKKFEGGEKYPKNSDYRMYWLTVAMNIMAQRGYELAHMNDRDVVMVRRYKRS